MAILWAWASTHYLWVAVAWCWCVHVPRKPLMPMALHSGSEVDSVALSRPAASSFSCLFLCMWGRHETPSSWVYYIRSAHELWSTTHGQWPWSGFVCMWLMSIAYRQWAQYSTSSFLGCLFWHVGSNIQHSCTLRMGAKALTTYGRRLHDAGVCLWLSNTVDRQPSPMCWWCVSCEVCVGQHGELRLLKHASVAVVMSFLLLPMATDRLVKVKS